jgi:SAM-dependent MidA family methyltransferase
MPNARLQQALAQQVGAAGGWLPFDEFMHAVLYTPGLGYYAHSSRKFGSLPARVAADGSLQSGSDFVTAPELSPLFGACAGQQVLQALQATGTHSVLEFGAGTGALALQICELLEQKNKGSWTYYILELSAHLRLRQQHALAKFGPHIQWLDALPTAFEGVMLGNEVLDAMPVKLLVRTGGVWHERGVMARSLHTPSALAAPQPASPWAWQDRPTPLRPPCEVAGHHDYLTEIHPQAQAFMHTVATHMQRGAAFFIDYGFPEAEYYHPQRHMGTLMCHFQHQADPDPLDKVGDKDITAHVNFTAMALAAQDAGMDVMGYATQGRFLMNCGLLTLLEQLPPLQRAHAAKLATEHEMGELFKVLALSKGVDLAQFDPMGFTHGDRMHTL